MLPAHVELYTFAAVPVPDVIVIDDSDGDSDGDTVPVEQDGFQVDADGVHADSEDETGGE